MDVSDRSDIELAKKLGKSYKDLTVGDVITNMSKPRRMVLEVTFDNYINNRQDKRETENDIIRLIAHCTELERNVILYLLNDLFEDPKWQKIRREAKRLNEEER